MYTKMKWMRSLTLWLLISLAAGRQGFGPGEQEWGYVTIRENVHMFWWLYYVNPPIKPNNFDVFQKPLLIWLHGGPGISATGVGNFEEIGPLDIHLNLRNKTWVHYYNILFIDQPISTGFSYEDPSMDRYMYEVIALQNTDNIFYCIQEIWKQFKKFEQIPTYIVGESYGGKTAVKLAQLWHQEKNKGSIKSNLKGIAIGNAWISPIDAVRSWAPYLIEMGIIDTVGFVKINDCVQNIVAAIDQRKWTLAKKLMDHTVQVIGNITDNVNMNDILTEPNPKLHLNHINSPGKSNNNTLYAKRLRRILNFNVTSALGLPNKNWRIFNREIYNLYDQDFMKPVIHTVEYLLRQTNLEIVVYHGHLDMLVPIRSTLKWMENLQWKYSVEWYDALRTSFKVNGVVQGYVKSYRNLKMYWIIRAGRMVPKDNPSAILAILQAMTEAN